MNLGRFFLEKRIFSNGGGEGVKGGSFTSKGVHSNPSTPPPTRLAFVL